MTGDRDRHDRCPSVNIVCSVAWSICLPFVTFVLNPLDRFSCHLANTLAEFNDTLCYVGVPDPSGEGRYWELNPLQLKPALAYLH